MAEHLVVPENSTLGRMVRTVWEQGEAFKDQLERLFVAVDTRLESGPDYARIETDFQLQTGEGEQLYTMIVGCRNGINRVGNATDVDYAIGKLVEFFRRCGP